MQPDATSRMKYTALEIDLKNRQVRIGACVVWAIAIIVVALSGHIVLGAPVAAHSIWKWVRGIF